MKTISATKFIGGILLIVGTSIGGGMLALPVANAAAGFVSSTLVLVACWLLMTLGALLVLEVNLCLPAGSNMVSMAKATLGKSGQVIAWISYLLLLYALLSAYISGGADVFQSLIAIIGIHLPEWLCSILFVLLLGAVVVHGIKSVDYVNRGLMFSKLGVYLLLVLLIAPSVRLPLLSGGHPASITGAIMVLLTSFGFATIVPSLRSYFHDDAAKLRRVIIIGSLIPLFCYIIWDAVIMGAIPAAGGNGLMALMHSAHPTTGLTSDLQSSIHNLYITSFFRVFTTICMLTAFLGVSLCLYDFLADGLTLQKNGWHGVIVTATTFLPPLVIVLFYPGAFIHALHYAGIMCVILLVLLPAAMAWAGRYKIHYKSQFQLAGGKIVLSLLILIGVFVIIIISLVR